MEEADTPKILTFGVLVRKVKTMVYGDSRSPDDTLFTSGQSESFKTFGVSSLC